MQVGMSKSFRVEAPIDQVWAFLSDIEQVAGCMSGAVYKGQLDDNRHAITITIKVGPIKSSYNGEVSIKEQDPDSHRIRIMGKGQDAKGKGGATMELAGSLKAIDDQTTEVNGDSTLTISGLLAQFGSRMVQDVSDSLFDQFTESVRGKLEGTSDDAAGAEGAAAVAGASLAATALKGAVRRTVRATKDKLRRTADPSK